MNCLLLGFLVGLLLISIPILVYLPALMRKQC